MFSIDFRQAVVRLYERLQSFRKVSKLMGCGTTTVHRWVTKGVQRFENRKARPTLLTPEVVLAIKVFLQSHPFSTAEDVQRTIYSTFQVKVSRELARVAVKKAGMTRKRPRFYPAPYDLEPKTIQFLAERQRLEGRLFVAVDETGFSLNVRPTHGYSLRGTRLNIAFKPSRTDRIHVSVVAAIDENGNMRYKPIEGHYSRDTFTEFLQSLQYPTGTVLLMDNVRFHHSQCVKDLAENRGWHLLYTPPYSPRFNPIEKFFSCVKSRFRKHRNLDESFVSVPREIIQSIMKSRCLE
jgi:transposase